MDIHADMTQTKIVKTAVLAAGSAGPIDLHFVS